MKNFFSINVIETKYFKFGLTISGHMCIIYNTSSPNNNYWFWE